MNTSTSLWCEDYRPKKIEECILPPELKEQFEKLVTLGEIPSLMLIGAPGTGKTTVARALCAELNCDYIIINCSEDSGIDVLRNRIRNFASTVSLESDSKHKVVILDEADYCNPTSTQPALRGFIEEFHSNCRFIFTGNYGNKIIPALHSRCSVINFEIRKEQKNQLMAAFFKRTTSILESNNIGYDSTVLAKFISYHFPDMRRCLNELQMYSTIGTIDAGILSTTDNAEFVELVGFLKDKNFKKAREWITTSSADPVSLFTKLYDTSNEYVVSESIPTLIVILGEYGYKANFVANPDLNLAACFVEIMAEVNFK